MVFVCCECGMIAALHTRLPDDAPDYEFTPGDERGEQEKRSHE